MGDSNKKKNYHFEVSSSLIVCNNKPFKCILYYNRQPVSWLDREETPKHFPKPNLHQKNMWWSLFGGSLQLSESGQNHYIWEVCSANRWDALKTTTPADGLGQQNGPNSSQWQCPNWLHVTQSALLKLNELGYEVMPHLPYSPDLWPTDYHFFKHLDNFLPGKHPQRAGCRKCFLWVHQTLKHGFLC